MKGAKTKKTKNASEETKVELNQAQENQNQMEIEKPKELEMLLGNGISAADLKKLKEAGICSVEAVCFATKKQLQEINGISDTKAIKLITAAQKIIPMSFQSGTQIEQEQLSLVRLSTGSKELDKILKGGIEACSITEVYGEFRAGKSQLCHTLSVIAQLPNELGGGNGKVLFLDTESTFRADRIREISKRFNVDGETVLENIVYAKIMNVDHQQQMLLQAAQLMMESKFSLIIVDSITNLYRTDFQGRGELATRQQHLAKFLRTLQRLATEFKLAVVITNQMQAVVDGSAAYGPAAKPIGGHILAHSSTTRLFLQKGKGETRKCQIVDSPNCPPATAQFEISDMGIVDSEG